MKISNQNIPVDKRIGEKLKNFTLTYNENAKTSRGVACRDPFILLYGDKYYLYQSVINTAIESWDSHNICCRVSEDLEHWSDPVVVFKPPKNFHGIKDKFWAPECHYYKGNFYIFTSCYSNISDRRSISVYRADNPLGPFEDIAGGVITPKDWHAIDGTLYVDDKGQPWMIFVREWIGAPDKIGSFVGAKLSEDFTHFISDPVHMFYANEPSWTNDRVTDGAYIFKMEDKLGMIWSNYTKDGYAVGVAYSDSGVVEGPWSHQDTLLYARNLRQDFIYDGGHGMIFPKKEGGFAIVLHNPNEAAPDGATAHIKIFDLIEDNGIKIK